MRYEWRIALRYLRARRRQVVIPVVTALSCLGVLVGTMALVIALALMTGFQEDIQERILGANAHILLFRGYLGSPLQGWEAVVEEVSGIEGVASAEPLVLEKGLIVSDWNPSGLPVLLRGVRSGDGAPVPGELLEGRLEELADEARGIFLGAQLADALAVSRGAEVRIISPRASLTPFGAPMAVSRRFEVLGTFEAGFYEYDTGWALVSLETAQRLFGEPGAVSTIQVQVERVDRVDDVGARISAILPDEIGLMTWKEMNRPLFSAFKLEKLMMFLTIGLIVVVAALGIVITLVMSVMEKTKDIGLLRALGASSSSVKWIFLIQGAAVGIVGTALGCALGLAAAWWLDHYQIIRLDPEVYFIPYVPFRVKPLEFTAIASGAVVVCFLATLYPARQAARLDPVEALRSE